MVNRGNIRHCLARYAVVGVKHHSRIANAPALTSHAKALTRCSAHNYCADISFPLLRNGPRTAKCVALHINLMINLMVRSTAATWKEPWLPDRTTWPSRLKTLQKLTARPPTTGLRLPCGKTVNKALTHHGRSQGRSFSLLPRQECRAERSQ
jgi:hypothetical protein